MISLYNIHIMAIDDILGRPVRHSIDLQFSTSVEEAKAINSLIVNNTDLCKGFRLSKKVVVVDQDIFISVQQGKKKIEWPSIWSYCKTDIIETISGVIGSKSYAIKEDDFQKVIVTQQQLWDILTKENWFKEQNISYKWLFKITTESDLNFPEELNHLKDVVIDYLKKQNGKELLMALLQTLFDLSSEESDLLAISLVKHCIVSQEASKGWHITASNHISLPDILDRCKVDLFDFLNKYKSNNFLSASFQKLFELKAEQAESLVKFLEDKGVIDRIELCHGTLNQEIASAEKLPKSLIKYQDILAAWLQQIGRLQGVDSSSIVVVRDELPLPRDGQEGGRQILNFLIAEDVVKEPYLIFPKTISASKKDIETRTDQIKKQIQELKGLEPLCRKYCPAPADAKEKEILDAYMSYINKVVMAVTGSAGHLKTLPGGVSASFRNISEYFTSGRYPPEVDDFEVQLLDRVILLKEYKSWWDWRAFTVAMIGVFQIIAGVVILYVSAGVLAPISNAMIAEGVNDIMFAIQTGLTGTFSWSAYGKQKGITVTISILTAGLATYATWSTAVAKTAVVGFRARSGLTMLLAAGKTVLGKIGKAVRSALIALGVEKLLAYLKKFIVEHVFEYIRKNVVGVAAMGAIKKMTDAMDNIWKATDGNVEHSKQLIRTTVLVDTANSDLHSTWLKQLSGYSIQVARGIVNTFSETTRELKLQQTFLDGVSQAKFDAGDSTGLDAYNLAKDICDIGKQANTMVEAYDSAMKWVGYLNTGFEVVTLISHTPEYISNVARKLEQQAHTLNMKKKSKEISLAAKSLEEFNIFKMEMTNKIEQDVLEHVMTRVNTAWLQPLIQRGVENIVSHLGKQTIQTIGYLFNDDANGLNDRRERVQKDEKNNKSANSGKKRRRQKRNNENILQEHCHSEDMSFADRVANIGKGPMARMLELQMVADGTGTLIEIDDPTGIFKPNSKDGAKFLVKPNGREPKSGANCIKLKVSLNNDGTRHVFLTDNEGNIIDDGQPNDGLNRCLYAAVAKYKQVSVEEFISDLKKHAINNERAKYDQHYLTSLYRVSRHIVT